MKIKNIKLRHIAPLTTGSSKRIGGTIVEVHVKKQIVILQLEEDIDGKTIFYEPTWNFTDTNLKKIVKKILKTEQDYKQYLLKEYEGI